MTTGAAKRYLQSVALCGNAAARVSLGAAADGYLTFVRDVKVRWSLIICPVLIAACLFGIQDMRLKKRLGVIYSNHSFAKITYRVKSSVSALL